MIAVILALVFSLLTSTAKAQVECSFRAPVWQVCSAGREGKTVVATEPSKPTPPSSGGGGGDPGGTDGGPGNSDGGHDHGKGRGHDGKAK